MIKKRYIQAQELFEDSLKLGRKVIESGFRPTFIIGVWRGGAPVGIIIQELFEYMGCPTDHIAIRTSAYEGIGKMGKEIRVHGLGYVRDAVVPEDKLLIVDDVYDTGLSIQAVLEKLKTAAPRNIPSDIRIATPYFKSGNNKTDRVPDYYVHNTDTWLIFPHELHGLTEEEIRENKEGVFPLISGLKKP